LPLGKGDPIPLDKVVRQVTDAVDQFRNTEAGTEAARYATLQSAEFTFQVVRGSQGKLDVKPFVFELSLSGSRDVTHVFDFTYGGTSKGFRMARGKEDDITKELVEMMEAAEESAKKSLIAVGLPLEKVDLSLEFAVKWDASIGGEFPFKLITLGGSVTGHRDQIQTVKLTFGRRK